MMLSASVFALADVGDLLTGSGKLPLEPALLLQDQAHRIVVGPVQGHRVQGAQHVAGDFGAAAADAQLSIGLFLAGFAAAIASIYRIIPPCFHARGGGASRASGDGRG